VSAAAKWEAFAAHFMENWHEGPLLAAALLLGYYGYGVF